jgi:hypothetical protein
MNVHELEIALTQVKNRRAPVTVKGGKILVGGKVLKGTTAAEAAADADEADAVADAAAAEADEAGSDDKDHSA